MEDLIVYQVEVVHYLSILFFTAALLYSLVGFGGGSAYISLLAISGVSHSFAPTIALICNIIVVFGGSLHFLKKKQLNLKLTLPFILLSVPMAYLGGSIQIERTLYQIILGFSLLVAAIKMLLFKKRIIEADSKVISPPVYLALIIGAGLGFLSGLVGIGGGIFLAPILYLTNWGSRKSIPPTASLFILINSISGLIGQVQKVGSIQFIGDFLPLILAVLLGGQIGSWLCSNKLNSRKIEVFTSILLITVSLKLLTNIKHFI